MKYSRLILTPFILLVLALPAAAEKLSLATISTYLNGLDKAEAEFTQINYDGTISTGQLFLRRPGRARFAYNPPEDSLVIAGGGQIAVFDPKSNQPPEQFPLARTPLNLILAKNVDLGQDKMVVGHASDSTTTSILAQDPKNPEYGTIEMVFTSNPVELRKWIITDGADQKTTVILGDLREVNSLNPALFNIVLEASKRGLN